jgi:hypothetical protein
MTRNLVDNLPLKASWRAICPQCPSPRLWGYVERMVISLEFLRKFISGKVSMRDFSRIIRFLPIPGLKSPHTTSGIIGAYIIGPLESASKFFVYIRNLSSSVLLSNFPTLLLPHLNLVLQGGRETRGFFPGKEVAKNHFGQ